MIETLPTLFFKKALQSLFKALTFLYTFIIMVKDKEKKGKRFLVARIKAQ